jgi:hypothetical protein
MKKIWLIVACVVVAGFVVLALMPNNKQSGIVANDAYKFYYYPKLNAYYDFQDGNFIYTIDGGETWQKKKPKNAKLPEKLSKKVMLSGPLPDIWKYNEVHRKAHNGINTNYLSKEDPSKADKADLDNLAKASAREDAEQDKVTAASKSNAEEPVVTAKGVKANRKPVQQIPEEEWEADIQVEADRLLNEGRKRLIREVMEVEDSF